jgi:predicted Zn-dependent protease
LHYTGSFKNPGTPEYLTTIANYLADQMGSDRRFGVEILNDARTNAFACPGGFLLITKGMLLAAQSEAEIAGVIAHEMAHVERGHMLSLFAQSSSKAIQGSLANRSVPQDEVMQIRRRKSDDSTHDTATDLITNSLLQASGGVLRTGVTMGLDALIGKGLSPEDEFEADALALEILTASGFDPIAYINFLERQFAANKRVASPIARTHPATIERVAKLRAQWVSLGSPTGATMKQRFKNQTQTRKVESQQ